MEAYKIGNKVNGIIRSYCAGLLGNTEMKYANQPYTVLKGVSAEISFKDVTSEAQHLRQRDLHFNHQMLDSVTISDVELTDKILNLIFSKSETKLAHVIENYMTNDNGEVFLNIMDPIYQVFIYDVDGNLEQAYGTWDANEPLVLNKANSDYLIAYSYEKEFALSLTKNKNFYLTLDLEIVGNQDDSTQHMWIHIDKCGLEIDNRLYFNQRSNAVDLTFKVIADKDAENYITLK